MPTPESAVGLALEVAHDGLRASELPIGAVVLAGDRIVGRAHTRERELGRRIVHADLLAMIEADEELRFRRHDQELVLAVTLEPCLMCMGAAITLGVSRIWYALESPDDGGHALLEHWSPPSPQTFFAPPVEILGGVRRDESVALFTAYAEGDGPAGMRAWARSLCP